MAAEVSKCTGNTGLKHVRQREGQRVASTCYPSLCIKPGLTLSGCHHGTVLDMVGW